MTKTVSRGLFYSSTNVVRTGGARAGLASLGQARLAAQGQIFPANLLEKQLYTEGIGQMLLETGAYTPEVGGEPWQDRVQD